MSDKPSPKSARKGTGKGHGGPAKGAGLGDGWGGPAKGASKTAGLIAESGHRVAVVPPEVAGRKKAHREQMIAVYEDIALDTEAPPAARIMAAEKWLDREEGKVPQGLALGGMANAPPIAFDAGKLSAEERAVLRGALMKAKGT
jgi:hypothetical protein